MYVFPGELTNLACSDILFKQMEMGEWPNNFAFLPLFTNEISVHAKIPFYRKSLPSTFARAFIVDFDIASQQTNLVCIQYLGDGMLILFNLAGAAKQISL